MFWRLMLFYTHLLLLLQPSVLWLSIATFNNDAKPLLKNKIWFIPNPTPTRRVTPPWNVYMAKFDPGWEGYPTYRVNVIQVKWEIIWTGGLPHLSGLPFLPPCKQALKDSPAPFLQFQQLNYSPLIIWVNLVPLESHFYDLISCYYFWTWVSAKCRGVMINCALFWSLG